jgi:IS30 family transposase
MKVVPYFTALHGSLYRSGGDFKNLLSKEAQNRVEMVDRFRLLRREKVAGKKIAKVLGKSLATLYRWEAAVNQKDYRAIEPKRRGPRRGPRPQWSYELEQAVLRLRRQYPMWSKGKLLVLLQDQGFTTSESSVGRILKKLIDRGLVRSVPQILHGRRLKKKKKIYRKHAQRLKGKPKIKSPGELIQIDHMTVWDPKQEVIKQFTAKCPLSRWMVAEVYRRATSRKAREFLSHVMKQMPFKIKAIQVDGGSEFMKEFEQACQDLGITLYVLPPRSPKLNGSVERSHGTWRQEFYKITDLPSTIEQLRPLIYEHQRIHNHIRPHWGLGRLTPLQYIKIHFKNEAKFSELLN